MANLPAPSPRTFAPGEVETGAFFNSVRDALNFLLNVPHFKGSITTATALTTATNIAFPSVEDNYSAWNATNHNWVVPVAGLYWAQVQFKWSATVPSTNPNIKILGGAAGTTSELFSPNAPSIASFQGMSVGGFVRAAVGDLLAVQLGSSGFTTQSDTPADNNFFELFLVSL